MRSRLAATVASTSLAVLSLAVAACGEKSEPPAPGQAGELTVMTFNVWYGGVSVDPGQIGAAIRAAGADVVGVQEPEGNLREIADSAGLPFVEESLHLISRYPIFAAEVQANGPAVPVGYVEVEPGRVVAVANAHLTCCPYGPNLARNGKSAEEVLDVENRTRLPEARRYARALSSVAEEGVPTFLVGDMNSPSHLDWTEEAVEARDLPYPLEWPASKALADAGLRDSYREIHPDPAETPGLTWTPGTPPPDIREDETTDRIDWVLAAGPAEVTDSRLVGEEGGPDVEVGVSPWGSDHRAVASDFEVESAPTPDLVDADPRVVTRGERVTIRYALSGAGAGRTVGIVPADSGRNGEDAIATVPIFDGADHIAPMLGTATLSPGPYRAAAIDADGRIIASSPFWVQAPGALPSIETDRSSYAPGDPIGVSWRNGPGNKLDYVGVFKAGDPNAYDYLGFVYVDALPQGSLELTRADLGELPPGRYVASLMLDDGYATLASAPFTVR
ncbi:MAG: endonuclease/exonuclease/phosphatase family protein [Solirubrobacterales bacterium]